MAATAGRAPLLSIRNVGYAVETAGKPLTILEGIDVDVAEGEFVCIVGGSGCGKTTLLHLIAGLATPTTGEVSFEGSAIAGPSRLRAIVFQDYSKALLPWRTVSGNVALSLEARGVPSREQQPIIMATAATSRTWPTGRSIFRASFPAACSSGCRSRVAWRRSRASF